MTEQKKSTADSDGEPTESKARANARQGSQTNSEPVAADAVVPATNGPSEESIQQAREDAQKRAEDPNKIVTRTANPKVAGESLAYLKNVGKARL